MSVGMRYLRRLPRTLQRFGLSEMASPKQAEAPNDQVFQFRDSLRP